MDGPRADSNEPNTFYYLQKTVLLPAVQTSRYLSKSGNLVYTRQVTAKCIDSTKATSL